MLISRRKEGETLLIGDDVEIRIISIRKKKVVLGIIAPREVRICTAKLTETELENTMAAAHPADLLDLLHAPADRGSEAVLFLLDTPINRPISYTENQDE